MPVKSLLDKGSKVLLLSCAAFLLGCDKDTKLDPGRGFMSIGSGGVNTTGRQLYIMLGDSQMVGQGTMEFESSDPKVFVYGFDGIWREGIEPTHDATNAVDDVFRGMVHGFSCGLSFAKEIRRTNPNVEIGLIPCGRNGTTVAKWLPSQSRSTVYGACLARIREAERAGTVAGMIVTLGTNDAFSYIDGFSPSWWDINFKTVVASMRSDIGKPFMPIVLARIGLTTNPDAQYWQMIKDIQSNLQIAGLRLITTDDLPLQDGVHYTTAGYRTLGKRFAEALNPF